MHEIFIQLSITLGLALVLSLVMKILKQPLIIGYIVAGIIVGPAVTGMVVQTEGLEAFSHMGIALLLFIVGLGLRPKVIKEVGKVAVMTGLAQIIFTSIVGYFIALALGFTSIIAFYLSLAFSLSSTIVIIRLLYKKEEQDTLYGRITIGFLLVQDLVAILFFIVISSTSTIGSGSFITTIITLLVKVVIVIFALYLLMKYITPKIDRLFASNNELLFIFSIAVCFVVSTIFYKLDFSLELGALVAGVMLSLSPYQREIANRLSSLRDFFLIIFFITMGAQIQPDNLENSFLMIVIFSLFIIIGNPIILMLVMRMMKYTTKTSVFAGLTVSQISEFSLIILAMGVSYGHIPESIMTSATIIALITITVSTYFITYNHQIYKKAKPYLQKLLSDKKSKKELTDIKLNFNVVLFGCHIMGGGLVNQMRKMKTKFLAIDHDPGIIQAMQDKHVPCIYGSADDSSLLDTIGIAKAKLVISTIPEYDINSYLISYLKRKKKRFHFVCVSNHYAEAEKLYKLGATYVIMPPYLGRKYVVDLFSKNKFDGKKYKDERGNHIFDLQYLEDEDKYI